MGVFEICTLVWNLTFANGAMGASSPLSTLSPAQEHLWSDLQIVLTLFTLLLLFTHFTHFTLFMLLLYFASQAALEVMGGSQAPMVSWLDWCHSGEYYSLSKDTDEVKIVKVKGVMTCDVSPAAMFFLECCIPNSHMISSITSSRLGPSSQSCSHFSLFF